MSNADKYLFEIFAYITLGFFFLSLLLVILITIFRGKLYDLGSLWKGLVVNWICLQLIATLIFTDLFLPCKVEHFLKIIFDYTMKWN